jgi:hypothetical protein
MQGPFEEGRENYCYDETDGRPEEERYHGFKWVKGLAQAIRNTGFGQVVGGHFETDAVADGEADEVPTHFAGDMGKDFVLVIQHYPEHGAGQNHLDRPFQFNGLFTAHISLRRLDLPSLGAPKTAYEFPVRDLAGIVMPENVDFVSLQRKILLRASEFFFQFPEVHFDEGGPTVGASIGHGTTSQIMDQILQFRPGQRVVGLDGVPANRFGNNMLA